MRLPLAFATLLALQIASPHASPQSFPAPEAAHLRYQRQVLLPPNSAGPACLVLDATTFAHAAQTSARDLRLFAADATGHSRETPYALSQSDTQQVEPESLPAQHIQVHGNQLDFDLPMPHRPYSAVELRLTPHDFIAVARVTSPISGHTPASLGGFVLFDLTSRHLPRLTTLSLAETTASQLHIELHLLTPDGHPLPHVDASMIAGATVPPSREAQVLYTTVAQSTALLQMTPDTIALFPPVPAHVPVERITFLLRPPAADRQLPNFARTVSVTSRPDPPSPDASSETLSGEIGRLILPGHALAPPLHFEQLHLPATLGVTLSTPARVEVAVHNQGYPRLPLSAVLLEMRQRSLCFQASPGEHYTLSYGDADLSPADYPSASGLLPSATAAQAELGPEQPNPAFVSRVDSSTYLQRHPDAGWVLVLAAITFVVLTTLESVKRQRHR